MQSEPHGARKEGKRKITKTAFWLLITSRLAKFIWDSAKGQKKFFFYQITVRHGNGKFNIIIYFFLKIIFSLYIIIIIIIIVTHKLETSVLSFENRANLIFKKFILNFVWKLIVKTALPSTSFLIQTWVTKIIKKLIKKIWLSYKFTN